MTTLPADTIAAVRALVDQGSEARAATELGVSRQTLARIIAGLPVQPGTAALVRERMTERRM